MKLLLLGVFGCLGMVVSEPILAEAGMENMPWYAQFGLCGLFGGILLYAIGKVLPKISEDGAAAAVKVAIEHKEESIRVAEIHARSAAEIGDKLDALGTTMEGVKAEIRAGNDSQLALLRNALAQQKGQA